MQSQVPGYFLHFKTSRGKSCPRCPLLLDLLREIFSLLFHAVIMSLKPNRFTAAEQWREHNPELYPAMDFRGGEKGNLKAPCRLECLKESCLRVWFKSGTHNWISARGCSCFIPCVLCLLWAMVLCLSEAHPWHRRSIPDGKCLGALVTESAWSLDIGKYIPSTSTHIF